MDVVYLFRTSVHDNEELRYSLRSVAKHMRFIRKVWVFGDDPGFLNSDQELIEHVPWEYLTWVRSVRNPAQNLFLQTFLVSLHPEVTSEFLLFCDDYVLIDHISEETAKRNRFLGDLQEVKVRGKGLWRESLWRTFDWLTRLGYGGWNFETHTPTYLTKRRVFDAYRDLYDFVTEDRFAGMLGATGILNHAYKQQRFPMTSVKEEGVTLGFHNQPVTYDRIVSESKGKLFMNFDDAAFSPDMRRFLNERFPDPCVYEQA